MTEVTSLDVLRWEAWLCGGAALVVVVCLAMVAIHTLSACGDTWRPR